MIGVAAGNAIRPISSPSGPRKLGFVAVDADLLGDTTRGMIRRRAWLLLPALGVLFSLRSSAATQHADVPPIGVASSTVKGAKVGGIDVAEVLAGTPSVKVIKVSKEGVDEATMNPIGTQAPNVGHIGFDGLGGPGSGKLEQESADSIDKAVQGAEATQGAPNPDEPGGQTEFKAMQQAGNMAGQAALDRGASSEDAAADAQQARDRVHDDYTKADGGAPAAPAPKEPAEGQTGEGGDGAEGSQAQEPAVIDVPPAQ